MEDLGMGNNPAIEFAGGWLGIGFLALVAAVIAGSVLLGIGYARGRIKLKSVGGSIAITALFGAIILGNINGGIQWGTTEARTMSLLPKGAQKQEVTVEKDPPKSTCTEQIKLAYDFLGTNEEVSSATDRARELLKKLVTDEAAWSHGQIRGVVYMPQGPDCSQNTTVAEKCSQVTVTTGNPDDLTAKPEDHDYLARGSEDC